MKKNVKISAMFLLFFTSFIIGYFCAICNFKRVVMIDYTSGNLKSDCKLFPFSFIDVHQGRAFNIMCSLPEVYAADWRYVGEEHFFSFINVSETTEGYMLLQAENMLVDVFKVKEFTIPERALIGKEFVDLVHDKGVGAASVYAKRKWDEFVPDWAAKQ